MKLILDREQVKLLAPVLSYSFLSVPDSMGLKRSYSVGRLLRRRPPDYPWIPLGNSPPPIRPHDIVVISTELARDIFDI